MITIQKIDCQVIVAVIGEFTLTDYQAFEAQVLYQSHFDGNANLVLDFRDMLDYTSEIAWQDIKLTRKPGCNFHRVAVITDDEWRVWSSWVTNFFIHSQVSTFTEHSGAEAWVSEFVSSEL